MIELISNKDRRLAIELAIAHSLQLAAINSSFTREFCRLVRWMQVAIPDFYLSYNRNESYRHLVVFENTIGAFQFKINIWIVLDEVEIENCLGVSRSGDYDDFKSMCRGSDNGLVEKWLQSLYRGEPE